MRELFGSLFGGAVFTGCGYAIAGFVAAVADRGNPIAGMLFLSVLGVVVGALIGGVCGLYLGAWHWLFGSNGSRFSQVLAVIVSGSAAIVTSELIQQEEWSAIRAAVLFLAAFSSAICGEWYTHKGLQFVRH